ncbi:hypothetical protein M1D97_08050 [Kushneria sp. AK178]
MKNLPGMLVGTVVGLVAWLPSQSMALCIMLGIACGVAWDIWRKRT